MITPSTVRLTATAATDRRGCWPVRWAVAEAVQRIAKQSHLGRVREQVSTTVEPTAARSPPPGMIELAFYGAAL